jgi:hypothetical protein
MSGDNDQVGYRRPPRHTQFRPGQSGNPKGRPKAVMSLKRAIEAQLAESITIGEQGRRVVVSGLEALAKVLVANALGKDPKLHAYAVDTITRLLSANDGVEEQKDTANDRELLASYEQYVVARAKRSEGGGHGQ